MMESFFQHSILSPVSYVMPIACDQGLCILLSCWCKNVAMFELLLEIVHCSQGLTFLRAQDKTITMRIYCIINGFCAIEK